MWRIVQVGLEQRLHVPSDLFPHVGCPVLEEFEWLHRDRKRLILADKNKWGFSKIGLAPLAHPISAMILASRNRVTWPVFFLPPMQKELILAPSAQFSLDLIPGFSFPKIESRFCSLTAKVFFSLHFTHQKPKFLAWIPSSHLCICFSWLQHLDIRVFGILEDVIFDNLQLFQEKR